MVKKYVFRLSTKPLDSVEMAGLSYQHLININDKLHNELTLQKNNITSYHRKRKWEKYKKLSNDYELIYSTNAHFPSISSHHPLSRSYFKLWEILMDLPDAIRALDISKSMRVAFLADAPGGFVQAFVDYRHRIAGLPCLVKDEAFAISLRPKDIYTPQWKLTPDYCKANNIELLYGSKQSGDLCDPFVVTSFVKHVGEGTCDLVTADGGFDFSSDFNGQEELSTTLIAAEVNAAMRLQKLGGSFVLKIYDIRTVQTLHIIQTLSESYDNVYIFKPLSSRPANSEKYIIASGFRGIFKPSMTIMLPLLYHIVKYNVFYISCQIACICKTIRYIHEEKTQKDVCKMQLYKAVKWCHKYKIAIDLGALHTYKYIKDTRRLLP